MYVVILFSEETTEWAKYGLYEDYDTTARIMKMLMVRLLNLFAENFYYFILLDFGASHVEWSSLNP